MFVVKLFAVVVVPVLSLHGISGAEFSSKNVSTYKRNLTTKSCVNSADCMQFHSNLCESGRCVPNHATRSEFGTLAVVGGPCTTDEDCMDLGPDSMCYGEVGSKVCICTNGAFYLPPPKDDKCYQAVDNFDDKCEIDEQCQHGAPGEHSKCEKNKCNCEGAVTEPGSNTCYLPVNELEENCDIDAQCTANLGELTHCNNKMCKCMNNAVPHSCKRKCLPIKDELGASCEEPLQCTEGKPGEFSECTSNKCQCNSESVSIPSENKCMPKTKSIGESCTYDQQCKHFGSSICSTGKSCECVGQTVPSQNNGKCLVILNDINDPCEENVQCSAGQLGPGAHCDDSKCQCEFGVDVDTCLRPAKKVGDDCLMPQQCTRMLGVHSICNLVTHKCDCDQDTEASPYRNRCHIPINGKCQKSEDCAGSPGASVCTSDICQCASGFVPSKGLNNCLQIRNEIADPCEESRQCQLGDLAYYSECSPNGRGFCQCQQTAIKIEKDPQCLLKADKIGDTCEFNEQCDANLDSSFCIGNICRCVDSQVPSDDETGCLDKRSLGQKCTSNRQCTALDSLAHCSNQTKECECDDNKGVAYAGKCVQFAQKLGGACAANEIQCGKLENSECLSGKCECNPSSYIPNTDETKCLPFIENLLQTCEIKGQCRIVNSECNRLGAEMKCQCLDDFVNSENLKECLKIVKNINDPCTENAQCSGVGENVKCVASSGSNVCGCEEGNIFVDALEKCLPTRNKLNQICEANEQCSSISNSLCKTREGETDKKCLCKAAYIESKNLDECLPEREEIGESCKESAQCAGVGDNVKCVVNADSKTVCGCEQDKVFIPSLMKCLPILNELSKSCEATAQCNIRNSYCKASEDGNEKSCQCEMDYLANEDSNECLRIRENIDEECKEDKQCARVGQNVTCISQGESGQKVCNCVSTLAFANRKCLPKIKMLNEPCEDNVQCDINNSICDKNQCACTANFVESESHEICLQAVSDLSTKCVEDAQCTANYGENIICSNKTELCECATGSVFASKQCHVIAKLGERCAVDDQCSAADNLTECSGNNRCGCVPKTKEVDNQCWAEKIVGSSCETAADCNNVIEGNATCSAKTRKCECQSGYTEQFGGTYCAGSETIHGSIIFLIVMLTVKVIIN